MPKFKVGDKVKITTSEKTGVVKVIYEPDYWNMPSYEYSVELDDGTGAVTVIERILDLIDQVEPRCECGVGSVKGNKHSDYCPLYIFND